MSNRREFLKCMAWAGTGLLCTFSGGVLQSRMLTEAAMAATPGLSFVQISDSHIGFNKPANPDVVSTFQACIDRINALPTPPAFVIHTGDLTHTATPEQFDTVQKMMGTLKVPKVFVVPGEHDVMGDDGAGYKARFKTTWYSFDTHGIHGVALVNVLDLKPGGMGSISREQLDWLKKDLAKVKSDTPVVVFAHMPLWTIYEKWGWGTDESAEVMGMLKRFGSVTVLNGHIHQSIRKVEGNVTFHTALSTAYPQPAPGRAPEPGPLKVDAAKLRSVIGATTIELLQGDKALAVIDQPLEVAIKGYKFDPEVLHVKVGTKVTWTNQDDALHSVQEAHKLFASRPLDTNDHFSYTFAKAGTYSYLCGFHPQMVGKVIVGQ